MPRALFIADPYLSYNTDEDTTFALMLGAQGQGIQVFHCDFDHLSLIGNRLQVAAEALDVTDSSTPFKAQTRALFWADEFDFVLIRKDPPFHVQYLQATWLLDSLSKKTMVINSPQGLRNFNEHLSILRYPDLIPKTIVTSDRTKLREFWREHETIVIKPVDGFAGAGIFVVSKNDPNASAIFDSATIEGKQWTMAQQFLPQAAQGDKRILVACGTPVGAILRVPASGETRGNLHVGGTALASEINGRDHEIIERIAPDLEQEGLWFVGIDIIGETLTEINVTSPTGARHMDELCGLDIGQATWTEFLRKRAELFS